MEKSASQTPVEVVSLGEGMMNDHGGRRFRNREEGPTFRVAHVCFVAVQTNFVEAAFPAWGEGVRSGLR